MGITFTFVGIFIALLGFDTGNIQESIPQLLDGMRLAFATSILGMVTAVLYRVTPNASLWVREKSRVEADVATIDQLNLQQERRHKELKAVLRIVHQALAGEGDTTLLTQIQKLRTSFVDKQDEMIQAFNTFAERMAEDQTEALIEALEEVIRDFNAKINEQFGENFKHLNEGVGKLLEWQKQHMEQLHRLVEASRGVNGHG